MTQSIAEALRPLAARLGGAVVEHEVLRITAAVLGDDYAGTAETARREVLAWTQNRSGGRLPPEAWDFENFEHMAGGRNSTGVRLRTKDADLWAVRADDPDKTVPGRTWTHEVVVGSLVGQRPRFSVRQLVSTSEPELSVEPHAPGFLQQVVDACGLANGDRNLSVDPWVIESEEDASKLLAAMLEPHRVEPLLVLTVQEGVGRSNGPLLDAARLSRATLGIGRVVVLPAEFTWMLTNHFGKVRSVFGGAARAYLPGFSVDANPYDHRLFLAEAFATPEGRARSERWLRSLAASESIRRIRLGRDVLAFAALRNAALRVQQSHLSSEGAGLSKQLALAERRVTALEAELEAERNAQDYYVSEATKEVERAEVAEGQLRASALRIQHLLSQLSSINVVTEPEIADPTSWSGFPDWCDAKFAGRLVLAPAARRHAKSAAFEDIALAVRALTWLATTYRDGRNGGADQDFTDYYFESGVKNSPCGGDEFDFDWQGRRQTADWHIKNGGNTRDPRRCLRIYYCWDPETRQIVVADMPAHRTSAVS